MIGPFTLFLIILRATLFSTNGLANLPAIRQDTLSRGAAQDSHFAQALAIGQFSPGPSGLWVISFAFLLQGALGAVLAFVAIALPPFLALFIEWAFSKGGQQRTFLIFLEGLNLAAVTMLLATYLQMAGQLNGHPWEILLVCGAFLAAFSKVVPLFLIIMIAVLTGICFA